VAVGPGQGYGESGLRTSCKMRGRGLIAGLSWCLFSIVALWSGGLGPVFAAADDPVLQRLEEMRVQLEEMTVRLENEEGNRLATDQRLIASIASLNVRFVHYRVDGAGNLTTGEGADFNNANARSSVVIQKSENMFCAISKAASWARGDSAYYSTNCEVARNAQNLWVITAKDHSMCRVACVGMELIR
jgi:hypothetical protein